MALTPESIAATWSNGGTVQIATPADLNVFNAYLQSNYTAETMRYAEITADLDFADGEIAFTSMYPSSGAYITNLTIDGNNHTIKGIVEDAFTANGVFFWGADGTTELDNITIYKCNIAHTGDSICQVMYVNTVRNVKIDHCRFSTTHSNGYIGLRAKDIQNYSSAVTVYCNNGGNYYGVTAATDSKRIALLDTVYRNTTGGTAYACYCGQGAHSIIFTRNRFHNFSTAIGIFRHYLCRVSTVYAAITAEDATSVAPLDGVTFNSARPVTGYYDNVLVPNAAAYTDLGLTTSELQSVATMTAKGFAVEEA